MVKVNELTGRTLDKWVARAEGHDPARYIVPEYSTDWSEGGPIIEREQITIHHIDSFGGAWRAGYVTWLPDHDEWSYGPTPLIAAMRAYVSSVYGDEVSTDNADSEGAKP